MYRVLVHAGLPKTATTTIQVNLFYPLHQEGKINFLGRYLASTSDEYYNPFGHIFSKLNEGLLDEEQSDFLREELYSIMDTNKLNVISEERLTLSADDQLGNRLTNLKKVLNECEVELIISIRNPIDFLFSYYVEMYRWKYFRVEKMNSVDKFITNIITNPNMHEFDILFFDRLLGLVTENFKNTKVLLFEDLKCRPQDYIQELSNSLRVDSTEIQGKLLSKNLNNREKTNSGKLSEAITLNQKISRLLRHYINKNTIVFFKKKPFVKSIHKKSLKLLNKIPAEKAVEHTFPSESQQILLSKHLFTNETLFSEKYNIELNKLKRYGYFK